jgi:hypothetical protein
MPAPVRTASNEVVNCPARSRTRNRNPPARSSRSISRLRACWVVHDPIGWLVVPRMCTERSPTSRGGEDVDPLQGDRAVDVEVVHGEHGRGLRAQEPSPGRMGRSRWCRRYPPLLEDPADRGFADAMAELEQFALDALVAPGRVLAGHLFDQGGDRVVDWWATGAVRVGPFLGDQAAVPPQDGGRGDQAVTAQHRGQAWDQRGEHGSVGPVEAGLGVGSAEYRDLSWRRTSSSMCSDDDARPSSASQLRSPMRIR